MTITPLVASELFLLRRICFFLQVVAARFVARDDAVSFQGTLRAAVASHGVSERLFVDYAAENAKPQNHDARSIRMNSAA